jgi:phosphatidylethanolamine/phosphatidyl-N-methylethanolamine N-methyltransferase
MAIISSDPSTRHRLLKRVLPRAANYVGNSVSSLLLFGREIIDSPRSMGAICPSSPALARRMAQLVPPCDGKVVELGGGTGTVTAALLAHGIKPEQLIVVERSVKLAALLRRRFPDITVINGDAANLCEILGTECGEISTVVSGLPLRSLPIAMVTAILGQLEHVLKRNGMFIQFTYSHRDLRQRLSSRFHTIHSCTVWSNLPPARIDAYRYCR